MRRNLTLIVMFFLCGLPLYGQTTEFTYQGSLNVGTPPGTPANTAHDFEFRLFTAESGGSQLGGTLSRPGVLVSNGIFSAKLNFGNQFQGVARWLEIRVKPLGGPTYTLLAPRQKVSPTPESIFSLNSDNASMLGGVAANQYVTTATANTNYIQNTLTPQSASFNISGGGVIRENLGIGTSSPATKLHVSGPGIVRARINSTANSGLALTLDDQPGWSVATVLGGQFQIFNDAIGQNAFWINSANNNVGIGTTSPNAKFHIADNGGKVLVGDPGCGSGWTGIGFASSLSGCTNYSLLGNGVDTILNRPTGGSVSFRENNGEQMRIYPGGMVEVNGLWFQSHPDLKLAVNGIIGTRRASAGIYTLCASLQGYIADCGSSIRYKENVNDFSRGPNLIGRLRPVSFNWKHGGMPDIGLVAEEVAEIEPLLVTRNEKGEVEGVKYDRVGVVLINAVKEQQAEIKALEEKVRSQEETITEQKLQINAIKKVLCEMNSGLKICKP